MKYKKLCTIISIIILLTGCKSNSSESSITSDLSISIDGLNISEMFTDRDKEIGYDEENSVIISLNNNSITCEDKNVSIDGTNATILDEGTYIISGTLDNGSIIVECDDSDKVQLVLDNVTITNDSTAALYVKQADKVFITLATNSQNIINTTGEFVAIDDNKIDGAIYSKEDLTLNGNGTLSVTCTFGHGIVSKDDLVITSGTYIIESEKQGLSGKDSVRIADGDFIITSGTDSIHSENVDDESLGFVYIANGTFILTSNSDGISSSYITQIDDGTFTIETGGGSSNASMIGDIANPQWGNWKYETSTTSSISAKGVKSQSNLIINKGTFDINSSDDAIHSNGNIAIAGGNIVISSGDDGIHADEQLSIQSGNIEISQSYEGIEGQSIEISGGVVQIVASDDGLNAAGGNDQSSMSDRPGANTFSSNSDAYISITGGYLIIDADGDGIDSNGGIFISDGEIYVNSSTNGVDSALDYDGEAQITGGTVVALGTSGMAMNFSSSSTQGSILINLSANQLSGTTIEVVDEEGNSLMSYDSKKQFNSILVSNFDLHKGETYTIKYGAESTTITLSSLIYNNGNNNGQMGGMNGEQKDKRQH